MSTSTPAPISPAPTAAVARLRNAAAIASLIVVVQLVLAVILLSGNGSRAIAESHGGLGYLFTIVSAVAAYFAWQATRTGSKGLFFHAVSVPVLAVIQIILAAVDLRWVHVALGVALVAAIIALFALAARATGAPRPAGPSGESQSARP